MPIVNILKEQIIRRSLMRRSLGKRESLKQCTIFLDYSSMRIRTKNLRSTTYKYINFTNIDINKFFKSLMTGIQQERSKNIRET